MNKVSWKILRSIIVVAMLALGLFLTIPAGAADYQTYSLDELNNMRGTMAAASTEERDAFRSARQSKIQALTPDERTAYQGNAGNGNGNGTRMQARDGSGNGSMYRHQNSGSSSGGGMGSGRQHRGGRR